MILLQGEERFGAPPDDVRRRVEMIADLAHLRRLGVRMLPATSWQDLLTPPSE